MMSQTAAGSEWIHDPNTMVFVTDHEEVAVGAAAQHGLDDAVGRLIGRATDEVKIDWTKTLEQMRFLLEGLTVHAHAYEPSEVTFQLAFTAQGGLAFIAAAGVTSSISVKFEHKVDAGAASPQ
jgi:hypothetical protein